MRHQNSFPVQIFKEVKETTAHLYYQKTPTQSKFDNLRNLAAFLGGIDRNLNLIGKVLDLPQSENYVLFHQLAH
jgi:hypothetical protein